jgi:hypothetical protein
VSDQRGRLLVAALGFAGLPRPSYDRALWARTWLDSIAEGSYADAELKGTGTT